MKERYNVQFVIFESMQYELQIFVLTYVFYARNSEIYLNLDCIQLIRHYYGCSEKDRGILAYDIRTFEIFTY